ncbi:MAG: class I SAM-dependent methyltransferase [Pseudomonadota bacterium]|nr:class I SAM-dependent methyltransferase [Pseudomonadota bacterium]
MNPVIEEIVRSGNTQLPDGRLVPAHSGIPPGSGRVIQHAIEVAKPALACEVGLAYGLSTLYILDAMRQNGDGVLIGMDPAQNDQTWQGGGLHNVRRAGFEGRYEFHEASSQQTLPRLVDGGTRIQFAFIDGWHTFDHTLVDFFYIDSMLDVGGVIVLDDVGYPGLQRLAHFIVCNRDYAILDLDPRPKPRGWRTSVKSMTKRVFGPLVRDNHSPTMATAAARARVDGAALIALRKCGEDRRRFDHFVPF